MLANFDKNFPQWKGRGYEIAGFAWWQGHKDTGNEVHATRYEKNLVQSINTLRSEFKAPDAPFAIATIGFDGHKMAGHTMGIQAVRVPTKRGNLLLASDASHYYEHWVKGVPFAICWSQPDLMTSYDKFEKLADSQDHVIPGHDPIVRDLYPAYSSDTGDEVVRLDEVPARALKDVFPDA